MPYSFPFASLRGTGRVASLALVGILMLLLAACGTSAGTSPSPTATTAPTATSTPISNIVKVFFSRHPDSDTDPTAVFPMQRASPEPATPTYALEQLFKGPTADEKAQGYYSPFEAAFGLISYCSGDFKDFTLALDQRGSTPESGTATLTFCRVVTIRGDLDGARMQTMVTMTLFQFPTIKKVVILNHDGNCFNDLRGDNQCLNG